MRVPDIIRNKVFARDNYQCVICHKEHSNFYVHHLTPKVRGGTNRLDNLVTICEECHLTLHPWVKNAYKTPKKIIPVYL